MTPNDVKTIADNVSDFIELPDGIARLRKAVLTLAVSGKLVPQDQKEGNAEDLYAEIQKERATAGEGSRKRTQKALPPITDAEVPFEIPKSWKWVRLGDFIEFRVGKTPPRKEPQYWENPHFPWVSIADLKNGQHITHTKEKINKLALDSVFRGYFAPKGSLLFSFKLTIGKMSILDVDACHNEAIAAFITSRQMVRDYLFMGLPALNMTERTSNAIKGMTLNSETIPLIEIPLPPLAEQKRIVAKVEEVMKELDILEAKKKERDAVRTLLTKSAAHDLGTEGKNLLLEHLTELVRTSDDIDELEGAVLDLASEGRLFGDAERSREQFVEFHEVVDQLVTGPFGTMLHKSDYVTKGTPVVNPQNISTKGIVAIDKTLVNEKTVLRLQQYKLRVGDVVLARRGEMGRCGLVTKKQEGWLCGTGSIIIRFKPSVDPEFALSLIRSPCIREKLSGGAVGATMQNLNQQILNTLLIPLPPLAEQKRIVAKVEEVMGLIQKLRLSMA